MNEYHFDIIELLPKTSIKDVFIRLDEDKLVKNITYKDTADVYRNEKKLMTLQRTRFA